MSLRIFDPDLHILDLRPEDVSFPLNVFLNTKALDTHTRHNLFQATAEDVEELPDRMSVLVVEYDNTQLPTMVKLFNEFDNRPDIWFPWQACSPELTLLPN